MCLLFPAGWPFRLNVQDVLAKRMASSSAAAVADPEMDMALDVKGETLRLQACLWCMRNPQIGCDMMSYCPRNIGARMRGGKRK